ncbi:hypothetical protein BDY24DRAFT_78756 [Mrakia frigida]|uniref:uncharacterized protein n=1 Tax=Mrakia frigida TaxID=29902 RepID=UPI003FCBEFDC
MMVVDFLLLQVVVLLDGFLLLLRLGRRRRLILLGSCLRDIGGSCLPVVASRSFRRGEGMVFDGRGRRTGVEVFVVVEIVLFVLVDVFVLVDLFLYSSRVGGRVEPTRVRFRVRRSTDLEWVRREGDGGGG